MTIVLSKIKITILVPGFQVELYEVSIEITAKMCLDFCQAQIVKASNFSFNTIYVERK